VCAWRLPVCPESEPADYPHPKAAELRKHAEAFSRSGLDSGRWRPPGSNTCSVAAHVSRRLKRAGGVPKAAASRLSLCARGATFLLGQRRNLCIAPPEGMSQLERKAKGARRSEEHTSVLQSR